MKQNVFVFALIAVIIGGGAFYGGMKYEQVRSPAQRSQFGNRVPGIGGRLRGGFRPVNGEIIASDAKSITVKLSNNSSRIIFVSAKTMINKAAAAAQSELVVGAKVAVFGTDNADGSVTAQNIQLNPISRMPTASPSSSPAQ